MRADQPLLTSTMTYQIASWCPRLGVTQYLRGTYDRQVNFTKDVKEDLPKSQKKFGILERIVDLTLKYILQNQAQKISSPKCKKEQLTKGGRSQV